jgi:hypothetical protein
VPLVPGVVVLLQANESEARPKMKKVVRMGR